MMICDYRCVSLVSACSQDRRDERAGAALLEGVHGESRLLALLVCDPLLRVELRVFLGLSLDGKMRRYSDAKFPGYDWVLTQFLFATTSQILPAFDSFVSRQRRNFQN